MKKSLIAIAISSVIFLSACNDKEKSDSTTQAQQSTSELAQLKSELAQTKAELENVKSQFPALKVEIETIFDKKEVVKHTRGPGEEEEYFIDATPVQLGVTIPKTNVTWLNDLLYTKFVQDWGIEFDERGNPISYPKIEKGKEREMALNILQKMFEAMLADGKANPSLGYTEVMNSNYVSQRNNIVTFSQFHNSYTGGAHGMYHTEYLNIDTDKRKIISLSDLFSPQEQVALKENLWNQYVDEWYKLTGDNSQPFVYKQDLVFSEQFYFSDFGITFVYAPYEVGPFAMGEIEVSLSWHEINDYLPKEYQQQINYIESDF